MRLTRFRVSEFRSVEDSGWIATDKIATLVGANESGKTNLMLALWKLNPHGVAPIDPVADMPRKKYYYLIDKKDTLVFVTGTFALTKEEIAYINSIAGGEVGIRYAEIGRTYGGHYGVELLDAIDEPEIMESVATLLTAANEDLARPEMNYLAPETSTNARACIGALNASFQNPSSPRAVDTVLALKAVADRIPPEALSILPSAATLVALLKKYDRFATIASNPSVVEYLLGKLPKLVFYASEGNLDGELYLPQIVDNCTRDNLRGHEAARMQTISNLFDLLGITPQELLLMGRAIDKAMKEDRQDESFLEYKARAEELLNRAEAQFNIVFNEWCGSTNMRFDFKLVGEFLRVRVCEDNTDNWIEMHHRSEMLQWLFSFCLTFMASGGAAADNILLLDEPELALHPMAQVDLYQLLESKSEHIQVVFCTHSPFLIAPTHLDRVTNVFNDERGYTVTGEDLRVSCRDAQLEAGFAVSSAVNLLLSDALLKFGIPVLVESVSDQIYLLSIKNLLFSIGEIRTRREITIIPCGGLSGVKAVLPMFVGKNNFLPAYVLGENRAALRKQLIEGASVFHKHPNRVVESVCAGIKDASLEDLLPKELMEGAFLRYMRENNLPALGFFRKSQKSFVTQVIEGATNAKIELPMDWRESVALLARAEMIRLGTVAYQKEQEKLNAAKELFRKLLVL